MSAKLRESRCLSILSGLRWKICPFGARMTSPAGEEDHSLPRKCIPSFLPPFSVVRIDSEKMATTWRVVLFALFIFCPFIRYHGRSVWFGGKMITTRGHLRFPSVSINTYRHHSFYAFLQIGQLWFCSVTYKQKQLELKKRHKKK